MKHLALIALLFATPASGTKLVTIDPQDPGGHLTIAATVHASLLPADATALVYKCDPFCRVSEEPAPDMISQSVELAWYAEYGPPAFPTWSWPNPRDWDYRTQPGLWLSQSKFPLAGPHAEADFVAIDGPLLPADAGEASLLSVDLDHLSQRLRLTSHVAADELVPLSTARIVSDFTLTYYDADLNLGWSRAFHREFAGYTSDNGFALIEGPTATLVPPPGVPEPGTWALLLAGLALIRCYRPWRRSPR